MKVLVIGASGDVGRGAVAACLARGWETIAVGRTAAKLTELAAEHDDERLSTAIGDLADETTTTALADSVGLESIDAVVVTVSGPWSPTPVRDCDWDTVSETFDRLLRPHVNAARILLPRLRSGATYLTVGGGMADAIFPGMAPVAMSQAAQRNFVRAWHRESRGVAVAVRQLTIAAMVNGHSTRKVAAPDWLTDAEIGDRICAILADPAAFPGPVLNFSVADRNPA
ncbi:SDR family NAD(P)-dependent oxidoreductase [Nocardia nova]|uniref:SDR family NAD(P)-dependent oxidoreductase n=1 Tax=Nocardia nova TaxID=37330 RepID=UPI0015E46CFC|nr:SDR family oxidoreductase [Nocardia nova]